MWKISRELVNEHKTVKSIRDPIKEASRKAKQKEQRQGTKRFSSGCLCKESRRCDNRLFYYSN